MKTLFSVDALVLFSLYFFSGLFLLTIFTRWYIWFTPYDERVQIRNGKKAPAIALIGAMIGFTIPILSMSYHGVNFLEYLLWSIMAGIIQLAGFKVLYWFLPNQIEADNTAAGIFYAGAAICVGLINAFSLIPS